MFDKVCKITTAGEAPLPSKESQIPSSRYKHETLFFVLGGIVVVAILFILWFVFRKRIKQPTRPKGKTAPSKEHQGSSSKQSL